MVCNSWDAGGIWRIVHFVDIVRFFTARQWPGHDCMPLQGRGCRPFAAARPLAAGSGADQKPDADHIRPA